MATKPFNSDRISISNRMPLWNNAMARLVAVVAIITAIGLLTVGNYGLSWDEPAGISTLKWNYEYVKNRKPMPMEVHKYNGTIFNAAAEAVYQVTKLGNRLASTQSSEFNANVNSDIQPPSNSNSVGSRSKTEQEINNQDRYDRNKDKEILERINIKHPFTFLTSLLAYLSVAGTISILYGLQYAWLGPIVLFLFPRFWGHSFFNHKDIPFAAVFSLGILTGIYLINHYLENHEEISFLTKKSAIYSALFGVLAGILTGIRLGGLTIIAITFVAYVIVRLTMPKEYFLKNVLQVSIYHSLTLLVCLLITIVCYPSSWLNPIQWFLQAGTTIAKYPWTGVVLFNGELYPKGIVPWYYIPVWFFISIPVVLQVAFVAGLAVLISQYSRSSIFQRVATVLVLLQVFLLPIAAILRHSVTYNEIRHFLFIIPGVAVLVAASLIWLDQYLNQIALRLATVACLIILLSQIRFDMAALHPYEYTYFNRSSRLLANTPQNFETDYWGLSAREAMEWINQNNVSDLPVLIGVDIRSATVYADSDISYFRFEPPDIDRLLKQTKPFYYLAAPVPSYRYQEYFQECQLVHEVKRQDIPMTIVRQCPAKATMQ
jgi:hypothetical protein